MAEINVVNKQGNKEPFRENKVYHSVYYPAVESGYDEDDADEFAADIVAQLRDWMQDQDETVFTSKEVRETVIGLLEEADPEISFMYQTHLDVN